MPTKKLHAKLSFVLLVAAALLIILGVLQGDYARTLAKAVQVCFECIGIG